MQKVVLSLDIHDDKKCKQKAMKIVSSVQGLDDIKLDVNERKLTIVGSMDIVEVVNKLRKVYHTTVISIGPAKEPEEIKDSPPQIIYVDSPWPWCYYYY